jgi:hypothetical protein
MIKFCLLIKILDLLSNHKLFILKLNIKFIENEFIICYAFNTIKNICNFRSDELILLRHYQFS